MSCDKTLRILLAAALAASNLTPAYGQLRLAAPQAAPAGARVVAAPLTAPSFAPALSGGVSAPNLALSAPAVLPSAVVSPAAAPRPAAAARAAVAAPNALPAARAAAAPRASDAALPRDSARSAAPVQPAAFADASARSAFVAQAVERVFAAPAARGSAQLGARLDAFFDSSRAGAALNAVAPKNADDDSMEAPEATASEAADFAPNGSEETLDLWVGKSARTKLYNSQVSASIRLINNKGSAWFWGKYQAELPVRVVSGGRMLFVTRITEAHTKKVKDLDLRDLKAYFGGRVARAEEGVSEKALTEKLRSRLLSELRFKAGRNANAPKVIGSDSEVRVLHYLPYRQAQHLPENDAEPTPAVRPRNPVSVPETLKALSRMLPRVVLVDLRLLGDKIPFDLLEDMGKLEKAGVTFVLLTDKPQEDVERMIERGVTLQQRDDVVRWKLLSLSNDGNTLYGYSGSFPKLLASRSFEPHQQAVIRTGAAAASPEGAVVEDKAYGLTMRPKKGVTAEALKAALERNIVRFGLPSASFAVAVNQDGTVRVRPGTLEDSMGWLTQQLEAEQGIYSNPEQVLSVTQNAAVQAALPGSVHASAEMKATPASEQVETALAALLGSYRENRQGDLVASASSIKAFKQKRFYDSGGGSDMRIYMLLGHVAHTTFDWAMQVYNKTGVLPPYEELQAKAHAIWEKENIEATVHLMEKPRERALGYRDSMDARMRTMYIELQEAVKLYPISMGTELPNLMVVERFDKAGRPTHRDIFRGLYDLVLARRVAGGLDVMIGDFKTGQTPALQHMLKDVQVLLYDFFSRAMWQTLSASYSVLGAFEPVVRRSLGFIYPRGMQGVSIGEFDRLPFEGLLANVMNGMRKRKGVKTPETIAKEAAKAEKAARAVARAAAKAAKEAAAQAKPSKKK
ncbi:MAG: hypothetical protein HY928_05730 [Elusimicrobia bacterium]|nr:hypothetical protein [Elusimicrobiota bacterium]